jgi:hypothetical protein
MNRVAVKRFKRILILSIKTIETLTERIGFACSGASMRGGPVDALGHRQINVLVDDALVRKLIILECMQGSLQLVSVVLVLNELLGPHARSDHLLCFLLMLVIKRSLGCLPV